MSRHGLVGALAILVCVLVGSCGQSPPAEPTATVSLKDECLQTLLELVPEAFRILLDLTNLLQFLLSSLTGLLQQRQSFDDLLAYLFARAR